MPTFPRSPIIPLVGWVERSDTHQMMGFAKSSTTSYALQEIRALSWTPPHMKSYIESVVAGKALQDRRECIEDFNRRARWSWGHEFSRLHVGAALRNPGGLEPAIRISAF